MGSPRHAVPSCQGLSSLRRRQESVRITSFVLEVCHQHSVNIARARLLGTNIECCESQSVCTAWHAPLAAQCQVLCNTFQSFGVLTHLRSGQALHKWHVAFVWVVHFGPAIGACCNASPGKIRRRTSVGLSQCDKVVCSCERNGRIASSTSGAHSATAPVDAGPETIVERRADKV